MKPAQLTRILLICYPVLAFVTWIFSVMMPQWQGHSLLSPTNIRHLATHTVADTAPWLLYAAMVAVIVGNLRVISHTLSQATAPKGKVWLYLLGEVLLLAAMIYLLVVQHGAALRGINGQMLSPQLIAIGPFLLLLILIILSTTAAWHLHAVTTWHESYRMWVRGLQQFLPYVIPLALAVHLAYTLGSIIWG